MNTSIRQRSIALAPLIAFLALGAVSCGGLSGNAGNPSPVDQGQTNPAAPQGSLPYPPVTNYGFFDPQTEDELKGVVLEGSMTGNPIANYGYMIAKVRPSFDPAKFEGYGLAVKGSMSAGGAKYYYLHKDSDLVETMKRTRQELGGLMFIEPDIAHYTTADPVEFDWSNPDPLVANQQQYGLLTTHTPQAWQTFGFGPNRAVVCDIDSGVRFNHEDLTNVVRHAYSWFGDLGDILTGGLNPYSDPEPLDIRVATPNAVYGNDTSALGFHGTHTAGTIVAEGGNGKGVAGVCWNADMVNYKGFSNSGSGYAWSLYGSLWHLVKWKKTNYPHTVPVNMSFTGPAPSQFAADMIEMALQNDVICVASSGNDYSGLPIWPGSYTGVMRVGATDYKDRRVTFSNWGPNMSCMAPGFDIYSTSGYGSSSYILSSGTSMSAPHVTGLAGYMLTFSPDLKPDQIRTYIEQNCDPVEGQKGFSNHTGWGRINTYRTIKTLLDDEAAGTTPPSNYVISPVKIVVEDLQGQPMNDVDVTLYNCDQGGAISNYAGSTLTGVSYFEVRDDPSLTGEQGVAYFDSLKPGFYRAVASPYVMDIGTGRPAPVAKSTQHFEIRRGLEAPKMTLVIDGFDPLFIQTLPTSNEARQNGDTVIRVHSAASAAVALINRDAGGYDSVTCVMPTVPGVYWVQVAAYGTTVGEYALWLSASGAMPSPAPGTFANPGPDGVEGGQTHIRDANSQLVKIDGKVVYGDMTAENRASGDWYRFVVE